MKKTQKEVFRNRFGRRKFLNTALVGVGAAALSGFPHISLAGEKTVKIGSMIAQARKRGTTRYLTGLVAITSSASICSVTFMVPSSAVIEAPIRPANTNAVTIGPSSLMTDTLTNRPTDPSADNSLNWSYP